MKLLAVYNESAFVEGHSSSWPSFARSHVHWSSWGNADGSGGDMFSLTERVYGRTIDVVALSLRAGVQPEGFHARQLITCTQAPVDSPTNRVR